MVNLLFNFNKGKNQNYVNTEATSHYNISRINFYQIMFRISINHVQHCIMNIINKNNPMIPPIDNYIKVCLFHDRHPKCHWIV